MRLENASEVILSPLLQSQSTNSLSIDEQIVIYNRELLNYYELLSAVLMREEKTGGKLRKVC